MNLVLIEKMTVKCELWSISEIERLESSLIQHCSILRFAGNEQFNIVPGCLAAIKNVASVTTNVTSRQNDALIQGWLVELAANPDLDNIKWIYRQFDGKMAHTDLLYWRAVQTENFETADWIKQHFCIDLSHMQLALIMSCYAGSPRCLRYLMDESFDYYPKDFLMAAFFGMGAQRLECLNYLMSDQCAETAGLAIYRDFLVQMALTVSQLGVLKWLVDGFKLTRENLVIRGRIAPTQPIVEYLIKDFGIRDGPLMQRLLCDADPEAVRWIFNFRKHQLTDVTLDQLATRLQVEVKTVDRQERCIICGDGQSEWCVVACCKAVFCRACLEGCWSRFAQCAHCRATNRQLGCLAKCQAIT